MLCVLLCKGGNLAPTTAAKGVPSLLADLIVACDLSIVGSAVHHHVLQAKQSKWTLPELRAPEEVSRGFPYPSQYILSFFSSYPNYYKTYSYTLLYS